MLPATGSAWLAEHAITGYSPAWHQPLGNGRYDAAVNLQGQTRWDNYYLEGLAWLVKNVGIDGIYLDASAYDHEIMKRVRKVLDRTRPGCLIDLHSNNWQGIYKKSPATFYIEHMPMIDSLWFGELFDYDHEPPDYWLVEISGIPYRAVRRDARRRRQPLARHDLRHDQPALYGDPRPIWKVWDEFGIQDARMIGYWDPACPVTDRRNDVLATAYVKPGKTLVSLASWAPAAGQVPARRSTGKPSVWTPPRPNFPPRRSRTSSRPPSSAPTTKSPCNPSVVGFSCCTSRIECSCVCRTCPRPHALRGQRALCDALRRPLPTQSVGTTGSHAEHGNQTHVAVRRQRRHESTGSPAAGGADAAAQRSMSSSANNTSSAKANCSAGCWRPIASAR